MFTRGYVTWSINRPSGAPGHSRHLWRRNGPAAWNSRSDLWLWSRLQSAPASRFQGDLAEQTQLLANGSPIHGWWSHDIEGRRTHQPTLWTLHDYASCAFFNRMMSAVLPDIVYLLSIAIGCIGIQDLWFGKREILRLQKLHQPSRRKGTCCMSSCMQAIFTINHYGI